MSGMYRIRFVLFGLLFCIGMFLYSDSYSGSSAEEAVIVRAPVWVFLEPQPGSFSQEKAAEFLPPREALSELSRYVLSGMTYGWKFSYAPYDKKRRVQEFFELTPVYEIAKNDKGVVFTDIKVEYPYCYCWTEYRIPEERAERFKAHRSIIYKTVKGRGTGDRFDELKGVYNAYTEAVKNAVREYARKILKNKPKEITGEVLIKSNPRLYVESGLFKAELELYLNISETVPYTVF